MIVYYETPGDHHQTHRVQLVCQLNRNGKICWLKLFLKTHQVNGKLDYQQLGGRQYRGAERSNLQFQPLSPQLQVI